MVMQDSTSKSLRKFLRTTRADLVRARTRFGKRGGEAFALKYQYCIGSIAVIDATVAELDRLEAAVKESK